MDSSPWMPCPSHSALWTWPMDALAMGCSWQWWVSPGHPWGLTFAMCNQSVLPVAPCCLNVTFYSPCSCLVGGSIPSVRTKVKSASLRFGQTAVFYSFLLNVLEEFFHAFAKVFLRRRGNKNSWKMTWHETSVINWHSSMVFRVVWKGAAGIASRNFRSSTKTSSGHLSPQPFPGIETKTKELRITNLFLNWERT